MSDRFAKDARWSLGIFVSRSIGSLLFVIVASRRLGGDTFGTLAGLSALTSLASVLVSNGLGHVSTMTSARSGNGTGLLLRAALRLASSMAAIVMLPYAAVAAYLLDAPIETALGLYFADVIVGGLSEIVGSVLIGMQRFRGAFVALGLPAIARLIAALAILSVDVNSIGAVTTIAAVCSALAIPAIGWLGRRLLVDPGEPVELRRILLDSRVFILGNVVTRVNNDFDKLLLPAQLGSVASVGSYALGYRLVEYSLLPLSALSTAAYPRLFRAGSGGPSAAIDLSRRLAKYYVGAGLIIALGLFVVRNNLDWLFGDTFTELAAVVGVLAAFPLLRSLTNLFGEPLTGAGHHRQRVLANSLGVAANITINLIFLQRWGWKAAATATYVSEVVQILTMMVMGFRLTRVTAVSSTSDDV